MATTKKTSLKNALPPTVNEADVLQADLDAEQKEMERATGVAKKASTRKAPVTKVAKAPVKEAAPAPAPTSGLYLTDSSGKVLRDGLADRKTARVLARKLSKEQEVTLVDGEKRTLYTKGGQA